MTYLVTGGTGFIGAYVVRFLIQARQQLVIYDLDPDTNLLDQLVGKKKYDQVEVVIGDITDFGSLIRTCKEYDVERIIHTAAIINSMDPLLMTRVNCEGTLNVLETARVLDAKRVVLTSSNAVFGPADEYEEEYIPNDAPHHPQTIYGASKSFNEVCARHYFSEYNLDTISIRFPHVYGMGRREARMSFDEDLFIKPALGKPGKIVHGDSIVNWLYVEDAARALVMTCNVESANTRAFTASGDICSVADVAAYVKTIIPSADITLLPGVAGPAYKFDAIPLRKEIGFRPDWTIERAIKKVVDYIQRGSQAEELFPY